MEEKIKSFRFQHGKKTYRMAWVVEFCLFGLALSLAAFNIVFGLEAGDLVSGLLLAVGWIILAVIELSIIPMAGSFRLAKGISSLYSGAGLFGLLFLSAFTVYEFNEIASEYMTRGARKAAITVEKLDNDISKLEANLQLIEVTSKDLAASKELLSKSKDEAIEAEEERFLEQKSKIESYYSSLLEESNRNNEFPIYNAAEKKRLERITSQIDNLNADISGLKRNRDEVIREYRKQVSSTNAPEIDKLKSQVKMVEQNIFTTLADKDRRVDEVRRGLLKSREDKIEDIQAEFRVEIIRQQQEKTNLESEIATLLANRNSPVEADEISLAIGDLEAQVVNQNKRKTEIEQAANSRMNTPQFKKIVEDNHAKHNRVYEDRLTALSSEMKQHEGNVNTLESKYADSMQQLEGNARTESERYQERGTIEQEISGIKSAINQIIEETAHQYERTMYFRMASWFSDESSTGFGKLPMRTDYNKSLRYIFAPIGLFFGLVSIILAYLGTSFMFEESQRFESSIGIDDIKARNVELEAKQKLFEHANQQLEEAEADKKHAIAIATTSLKLELESKSRELDKATELIREADEDKRHSVAIAISTLKSELEEAKLKLLGEGKLKQYIADLKVKLSTNESDLIKAKQRVFEAIRSIPQSITILDESKSQSKSKDVKSHQPNVD